MVEVEILGQLVDSMEQAVLKLEQAVASKNSAEIAKLKTFIFDLHRQIDSAVGGSQ